MARQLFCIDFGSSYTKVGYRAGVNSQTQLIPHADNTESDEAFCFPSAVLVDDRGASRRYLFGSEVGRQKLPAGMVPKRNWKPDLFTTAEAAPIVLEEGLDALLASDDFSSLVRRYRVAQAEVDALMALYRAAGMFARRSTLGRPAGSPRGEPAPDLVTMAVAYFRDLRQKVIETAEHLPGAEDPARIPTRLCVPAFGNDGQIPQATCELFQSILSRAGWVVDEECPLIAEPVANVIGVISEGENVTWRPRPYEEHVNLGRMFHHGPLIKAYRAGREQFAILVCDIGSYTTDFAVIQFRTNEDPDLRPVILQTSIPLGIAALDDRVASALPPHKTRWLQNAAGRRRELCKRAMYVDRQAYATIEVGDIGDSTEREAIDDCLGGFGTEITRAFQEFCVKHSITACDEVVLTGGGNHIPTLRHALLAAMAMRFGTGYLVRVPPGTRTRSAKAVLTPEQVRGGSALGGCSVYFDRSYH